MGKALRPAGLSLGLLLSVAHSSVAQTATIAGTVTDSLTAAPLDSVTISAIYPGGSNVVLGQTITDAAGHYSFPIAPGSYNVRATKTGYRIEWFDDVKCDIVCDNPPQWTLAAGDVLAADITLDPLASISGTVVDAATQTPLVSSLATPYYIQVSDTGGTFRTDDTDASGRYSIDQLLPGTYFVKVMSAPGYVAEVHANISCIASDCPPSAGTPVVLGVGTVSTIDFALDAGGVITGTIRRASNGSPLPFLSVTIYNASTSVVRTVSADAAGVYRVDGLATGSYYARVTPGLNPPPPPDYTFELFGGVPCPANDCRIASGTPIAVVAGATTAGIDFALDAAGTISGTVTASGSTPPSGAVAAFAGGVQVASGLIQPNGQYSLVLPPGAYQVRTVSFGPYVDQWFDGVCVGCAGTPTPVVVGSGVTVNITFALSTGGAIEGTVACEQTSPFDFNAGPHLYLFDATGRPVRSTVGQAGFGICGNYRIEGLASGQYYVLARDTPSIPFGTRPYGGIFIDRLFGGVVCMTVDCDVRRGTPVTVTTGQTTPGVDFDMKQGASSPFVTTIGEPLLMYDARGVQLVAAVRSGVFTGQQAMGLPPGTYFARLGNRLSGRGTCPDCPPTSGRPIVVAADLTGLVFDFSPADPGRRISGRVTAESGDPLSTVTVELYTAAGNRLTRATSDLNGNYVIPDPNSSELPVTITIPSGTYFLRTRNDRGYVDEAYPDLTCVGCDVRNGTAVVIEATDVTGIDFTLAAGGIAEGTVTDDGGVAVSGVPVSFFSSTGTPVGGATSTTAGHFSVALPTASYRARADASVSHGAELFSERPCTSSACDVAGGTPIPVTAGTSVSNVNFTLANCSAMTLAPPVLASGVAGRAYRQVFSTSGGAGPFLYRVTGGALPLGLTVGESTGVLEGTPTVPGRHAFTVGVLDANGCATARDVTLDVQDCAFTLSPSSATLPSPGGTVTVTIADACGSQAVTGLTFVTVQSNTPGQVVLNVPQNTGAAPRANDVTIGRRVFAVLQAGVASQPPFGVLDTPGDGAQVTGSVAIGGWALDDLGVTRVLIFRDPVPGEPPVQIFIGTAVFVRGARPDVRQLYPTYPQNDRAGWGYLILTNMLPNQGNGIFRLYAYAEDAEGSQTLLGARTIVGINASATSPFGAIDTPAQGETVAGTGYINWGWALTPQPKIIPTDGSTVLVLVDGVVIGPATYNLFRADVAGLFPGLANSGGPVGARTIDTTALAEGQHTIAWLVTDSAGAAAGIGSRYFTVANSADAQATVASTSAGMPVTSPTAEALTPLATLAVMPGDDLGRRVESLASNNSRELRPRLLRPTERLELPLERGSQDEPCAGTWDGYLVEGNRLEPLPVGAALDRTGTFYWQPGPGFAGVFHLRFIRTACDGSKRQVEVAVTIRY